MQNKSIMPTGKRRKAQEARAKRNCLSTPTRLRRLRGWLEGGGWLVGREFVRFDIHLEIQFNFPAAIPLSRASQRVENRDSRDEGGGKGGGEGGWYGRKIGKRATGCSTGCRVQH